MGCTQSKGSDEKKPTKPLAATPAAKKENEPSTSNDTTTTTPKPTTTAVKNSENTSSENTTTASAAAPVSDGTAVFEDKPTAAPKDTTTTTGEAPVAKTEDTTTTVADDEPVAEAQSEGNKFQEAVDAVDAAMESTTATTVHDATVNGAEHGKKEEADVAAADADTPFTPDVPVVVGESPPKAKRVPRSPLAAARRLNNNDKRRASNSGAENNSVTSSRRGSKSEADEMDGTSKTQQKKREKLIKSGHQSTGRVGPTGRRASLGAENNTQADVYLEMVSAYERQLTNPGTLDAQLDTR